MDVQLLTSRPGRRSQDLYQQLKGAILDGRLRPGEALPATRGLAQTLGVARNTVLDAYRQLTAEGFLEGRAGAGTVVRSDVVAISRRQAPRKSALRPRELFREPGPSAERQPEIRWDFRIGIPDPALFPWDEWRRRIARGLRRRPREGGYLPAEGDPRAREAIARHIGLSRSVRASGEDVLLTAGAQQALALIGRALIDPGAVVAIEDPGYLPARRLFESLGARVVPVPVDNEGLQVESLPREAGLVYVTPSHQFPLGMPMSLARRLALLEWSGRTGAAIVEDDYDSEFRFDGRPLEPLQSLDRHGRVLYVGTFSKVLLPALRLGFLVAPGELMPALRQAKALSDWHGDPFPQRALAGLIDDGFFARHLRRIQRRYAERREQLFASVEAHLGNAVEQLPSYAGLHHSLRLRDPSVDACAWAIQAREAGVAVEPLAPYFLGEGFDGLALGYGGIDPAAIDEGIRRLAACRPRARPSRKGRPRGNGAKRSEP